VAETDSPAQGPATGTVISSELERFSQQLGERLDALAGQSGSGAAAVRWQQVAGLLRRARGQREGLVRELLQRAQQHLQVLEARSAGLPANSSHDTAKDTSQDPVRDPVRDPVQATAKNPVTAPNPALVSPLRQLVEQLEQQRQRARQAEEPNTFEAQLRRQEIEALQQADDVEAVASLDALLPVGELKALQAMRESWARRSTEKAVAKALQEAPEDAGPLNAHRLVVRSLMAMQDIAPQYLGRFVTYVETLLWLEQAGNRLLIKDDKARGKGSLPGRRR